MLRIVSSSPRRSSMKWALGLILTSFCLTILFLLNRTRLTRFKSIFIGDIYNDRDVRTFATLCQPSVPALSNNTYACLGTRPPRLPQTPSDLSKLPHTPLPQSCLDAHFAAGVACSSGNGPGELDVVWIWANGSDPMFQDAIESAEEISLAIDGTNAKVGLTKGAKLYRCGLFSPNPPHTLTSMLLSFLYIESMTNYDIRYVRSFNISAGIPPISTSSPLMLGRVTGAGMASSHNGLISILLRRGRWILGMTAVSTSLLYTIHKCSRIWTIPRSTGEFSTSAAV
jgi:hypothetical protein